MLVTPLSHFITPKLKAIDALPFFKQLNSGLLEKSIYQNYLEQDALYLKTYQQAILNCAELAPKSKTKTFLFECAKKISYEPASHETKTKANQVCQQYINYLRHFSQLNYETALACIFPCFYVYCYVGQQAKPKAATHRYKKWYDCYQGSLFLTQCISITALVNQSYIKSKAPHALLAIIKQGIELECAFHSLPT